MTGAITSNPRFRIARLIAWTGAVIGAAMLALQLWLLVQSMSAGGAIMADILWRYFGFFTIIMNIMAVLVMGSAALRPTLRTGMNDPRTELAVATAMTIGALVYSVALRSIWNPQGSQLIADHGLHDLMPGLFLLFWILRPHGQLRIRDVPWMLVLPGVYCFYALIRGAFDGWYAYHFLDAAALDAGILIRNIAILLVTFLAVGLALTTLDRVIGRMRRARAWARCWSPPTSRARGM